MILVAAICTRMHAGCIKTVDVTTCDSQHITIASPQGGTKKKARIEVVPILNSVEVGTVVSTERSNLENSSNSSLFPRNTPHNLILEILSYLPNVVELEPRTIHLTRSVLRSINKKCNEMFYNNSDFHYPGINCIDKSINYSYLSQILHRTQDLESHDGLCKTLYKMPQLQAMVQNIFCDHEFPRPPYYDQHNELEMDGELPGFEIKCQDRSKSYKIQLLPLIATQETSNTSNLFVFEIASLVYPINKQDPVVSKFEDSLAGSRQYFYGRLVFMIDEQGKWHLSSQIFAEPIILTQYGLVKYKIDGKTQYRLR